MPVSFDRFRYLNGGGKKTEEVEYAGFSDMAGTAGKLPTRKPVPSGTPLDSGKLVVDVPAPSPHAEDLGSLRILRVLMADGALLTGQGLLLPCPSAGVYLVEVDVLVTATSTAGAYKIAARLTFSDGSFSIVEDNF